MPRRALFRFLQTIMNTKCLPKSCVNAPEGFVSISTENKAVQHKAKGCVNAPEGFVSISTVPLTKIPVYSWILEGCIFDNKSGQYTLSIFFVLLTF